MEYKNIFNKLLDRILKHKNMVVFSVIVLLCSSIGSSYSLFLIDTSSYTASELYISNLIYGVNLYDEDGILGEGATITVPANTTVSYDIEITNLNSISTKYKLGYNIEGQNTQVYYSDLTNYQTYGYLDEYGVKNYIKKVRVSIINNSSYLSVISFEVKGGYSHNDFSDIIVSNEIVNKYNEAPYYFNSKSLVDIVKSRLKCNDEYPCIYKADTNVNNYVSYSDHLYRIMGLYEQNNNYYIKLIDTQGINTTYISYKRSLDSYMSSLYKPSLYLSSGYYCPNLNECNVDKIGLLSTWEYIKQEDNYSYLNMNDKSLTMTVSDNKVYAVMEDGTLNYIDLDESLVMHPVFYLNSNVRVIGTGTKDDPFKLYTNTDFRLLNIYVDGTLVDELSSDKEYYLDYSRSICSNNETISWDKNERKLSITPYNSESNCKIYLNSTSKYTEDILNGADPVLEDNLIPVVFDDNGNTIYASTEQKWYEYSNKNWANSVLLVDNPSKSYNVNDTILDEDIKGYFVWIPKYSYNIFNYNNYEIVETITNLAKTIDIKFGVVDTTDTDNSCLSNSTACSNGKLMTHPAFENNNGFWVSKFELGYKDEKNNIVFKPNTYSLTNDTHYNIFINLYNYNRNLNSQMISNLQWGAIAYLTYSAYGANENVSLDKEMTSDLITDINSSTTTNMSGVYDMTNNNSEFVSAYTNSISTGGWNLDLVNSYSSMFDIYDETRDSRILGDATSEMGPFNNENVSSWNNAKLEIFKASNVIVRGTDGKMLSLINSDGNSKDEITSRVVLIP